MKAILGKKVGMTQVFDETGRVVPVTVIQAGGWVVQKKTKDTDGYEAIQVGFDPKKDKHVKKPEKGHFAKAGVKPTRMLMEFRGPSELEVGAEILSDIFAPGTVVDVVGTSKGKGFQGVVKREGFSGGPATHGSKTGRIPGSLGASAWPSRVIKGKRLPGQMGNYRITVRNVIVVGSDPEQKLLWIRGAVPGARNSMVLIREAKAGQRKARKAQAAPAKPAKKK
ncbi:MAG TPA: 50S ribosomal protein L3 [Candidatus Eisenbacteria bacterium]|nr:50S ribosomal protein L3 [Candidatus Eisenbacteria bacterium]